jgi:hypothetical protein
VFNRTDVLEAMDAQSGLTLSLSEFVAKQLSPELVLATYRATIRDGDSVRHSLRSSLWVHRASRWQLVFHQGTLSDGPAI